MTDQKNENSQSGEKTESKQPFIKLINAPRQQKLINPNSRNSYIVMTRQEDN